MSVSGVTLVEVLRVRGRSLAENEVWALLLAASQHILNSLSKGSSRMAAISPWSLLLSSSGKLSLHGGSQTESAPFRAPEISQSPVHIPKVLVYSLGMTLYWASEYNVPADQPLSLGQKINTILISMCEENPQLRPSPETIIQKCQNHQKLLSLPSPALYIQGLASLAMSRIPQMEDSSDVQLSRSRMIRERLHHKLSQPVPLSVTHTPWSGGVQAWPEWDRGTRTSSSSTQSPEHQDGTQTQTDIHRPRQNQRSNCTTSCSLCECDAAPRHSASVRSTLLSRDKIFRPEFVRFAEEPPVTLELPARIVMKNGRSYLSQRTVSVILPSGLCLDIKCDGQSRTCRVLEAAATYTKLEQHSYFGLAQKKDQSKPGQIMSRNCPFSALPAETPLVRGKDFFFLDDDSVLEKVAPGGWSKMHKKKTNIVAFILYLRVKFFVQDISFLRDCATRHQIYLQLRKDILEHRLQYSREATLNLASLALQAEIGDHSPECQDKEYFLAEDFVPPELLESPHVPQEIVRLHKQNCGLLRGEAELAFLEVAQQLPEYGVLFYHVLPYKRRSECGGITLGFCSQGIIVYEDRRGSRTASLRFPWREIQTLSSHKKKFSVLSCSSNKKLSFLTDSDKTSKYLLDLCSALRSSHSSLQKQLDPEESQVISESTLSPFGTRKDHLLLMQRMSRSEHVLGLAGLTEGVRDRGLSKSCDAISVDNQPGKEIHTCGMLLDDVCTEVQSHRHSSDYLSIHSSHSTACNAQSSLQWSSVDGAEREIVRVTLRRDAKYGLGFVIIGGENIGKLDLGIFVASIIPGGPAERDGRIKPGGRLISMNNISLEGVTFNCAVQILQGCGEEAELILSQPKGDRSLCRHMERHNSDITWGDRTESSQRPAWRDRTESSQKPASGDRDETEDEGSRSQGLAVGGGDTELRPGDVFSVQLQREDRGLGFSVTGGVNTSVRHGAIYVKSIVPLGPAELTGKIKTGDCLLEVNTERLLGFTHRQAVECLKNAGRVILEQQQLRHTVEDQVVTLVLQRGGDLENPLTSSISTRTTPSGSDFEELVTKENTFEVTLRKNSAGLGFSFVQAECSVQGVDIIRIKRLFQGQPAQESGQIAAGDVLLAVNGKPVQGLNYQEVLHLLHGAPSQVTLLICRPEEGVLSEMDYSVPTPRPSPVKDLLRMRSPNLDLEGGVDTVSGENRDPEIEKTAQELFCVRPSEHTPGLETLTSLARDVRLNCYSTCELEEQESAVDNQTTGYIMEVSHMLSEEDYLTISSTSVTPPSWEEASEKSTAITATPQPRVTIPQPASCSAPESCDSESEWEDVEEPEDLQEQGVFIEQSTTLSPSPARWLPLPPSAARRCQVNSAAKRRQAPSASRCKILSPVRKVTLPTFTVKTIHPSPTIQIQPPSPTEMSVSTPVSHTLEFIPYAGQSRNETSVLHHMAAAQIHDDVITLQQTTSDFPNDIAWSFHPTSPQPYGDSVLILHHSPHNQSNTKESKVNDTCLDQSNYEDSTLQRTLHQSSISRSHFDEHTLYYSSTNQLKFKDTTYTSSEQLKNTIRSLENFYNEQSPNNDETPTQPNEQQQEERRDITNMTNIDRQWATPSQVDHCISTQWDSVRKDFQDSIVTIALDKSPSGTLGFSVAGGKNGDMFTIKAISPGSLAAQDGRLSVGDELLQVNDCLVTGLTHAGVVRMLRKAEGRIHLVVCKNNPPHTGQLAGGLQWQEKDETISPTTDVLKPPDQCAGVESMACRAEPSGLAHDSDWSSEDENGRALNSCLGPWMVHEERLQNPRLNSQYSEPQVHALLLASLRGSQDSSTITEFVTLEHEKPVDSCLVAAAPENRMKNRYRDILPYDGTRVPVGDSDKYINASYITIPVGKEKLRYICTQGPLPSTVTSFWQMVWGNGSSVIVMMTQERENGKVKCERYWPDITEGILELEWLSLKLESYQVLRDFTIRIMSLTHMETGESRRITHLQFTTWPDHGIPESPQSLLRFVCYLKSIHGVRPLAVHCSAGVGRSGVFICVHVIVTCLELGIQFQISDIVRTMRHQRYGMIQTKEQYQFCYKALLAAIQLLPHVDSTDLSIAEHRGGRADQCPVE